METDPELTDVAAITAATGSTYDANNRVSNSSSNSNSSPDIEKLDHMRLFVQQREHDESKTACDLADELLTKHSNYGKEITPGNLTSNTMAIVSASSSSSSPSSSTSTSSSTSRKEDAE